MYQNLITCILEKNKKTTHCRPTYGTARKSHRTLRPIATSKANSSSFLADDCKTRKDTKYRVTKQRPNTPPPQKKKKQREEHQTMNKQQQNHRLRTDISGSNWRGRGGGGGLKCILLLPAFRPILCCCQNTNDI